MADEIQQFDVCVVCAMPEEARAFLEVVQEQCTVAFQKHISAQYKYDYQSATIKNDKDEPLNLHVSWLPRYGPTEIALHLPHVLEEYQPRIAIMTGICAGDAQRVQLGDLVVAERTFTFDNGKFTLDEYGRSVHEHDAMTYHLDATIQQFLGLFDEWKPLVAGLQRPLSFPQQREITCHIKAMASGSAVRGDHPFEDVRAPVRATVAIDMEGAAFGLVMSRHPLIPWLVVKGVCDYADQDKNDVYHDYAARASALYALSFIRAYITEQRMPRSSGRESLENDAQNKNVHKLAVSSPQAASPMALPLIEKQSTGQPPQRQWLVGGSIVALVVILLGTMGGIWLSHRSGSTTTGQNQQPTLTKTATGTPRQGHLIGMINEYPIPTSDAQADSITLGPDGNLWFTEDNAAKIGWITPQGHIREPLSLTPGSNPSVIVLGPDRNLWVLENGSDKIARVTPQGHIREFPLPPGSNPVGLAAGKDGNLWFTEFQTNKIGRMNTSGEVTGEFPIPTLNSGAASITQGPDGNLWFDEQRGNQIGQITPDGHIAECAYSTPPVSSTDNNHNLTAGPDGNVWFTDFWHNTIGWITPDGCHITEYAVPTPNSVPTGIVTGPDGNLWFTECVPNSSRTSCESSSKIGRITPQGQIKISEYSLPIPNSGPAGITTGPDGNVWFTEDPGNKIGKFTREF